MIDEPQQNEEPKEDETTKPIKSNIYQSALFVVDMMNQGKVDPKDVYPKNRYHGD